MTAPDLESIERAAITELHQAAPADLRRRLACEEVGGALFVKEGVGWLDWGATDSDYRQRDSQAALLRHRIRAALDMGCHTLVSATGEEVPGDPQHSYRNIVRMGFRECYARENYALPKGA